MNSLVGSCENCHESCLEKDIDHFQYEPHISEAHSTVKKKLLEKKINDNILVFDDFVQEQIKKFQNFIFDLITYLRELQKKATEKFKQAQYESIFQKQSFKNENLSQILQKIENGAIKNVTCHQIFVLQKNFPKKNSEKTNQILKMQISQASEVLKQGILKFVEKNMNGKKIVSENEKNYIYAENERNCEKMEKNEREKPKKYYQKNVQKNNYKSPSKVYEYKSENKKKIQKMDEYEYYENDEYVKVEDLDSRSYKSGRNTFKIKLKVLKLILFRYISKNHKYTTKQNIDQKLHHKVKFIAGDETGVIICFTNWNKRMTENSVIELHNCQLDLYQERSYEIFTTSSIKIIKENIDKIKKDRSISNMTDTNNLKYTIQKFDPFYPTLQGLPYLNYDKAGYKDCLNFVVEVDCVFENEKQYQIKILDFTGFGMALISKKDVKNLKKGQVLMLRNVRAVRRKELNSQSFVVDAVEDLHSKQVRVTDDFVFPWPTKK